MTSPLIILALATLAGSTPAAAQDFNLHVEPAAAFWLDTPQSDHFDPGFYLAVRPGLTLGSVVALQLSYALLTAPPGDGYTWAGSAQSLMGGLRLRPFAPLASVPERQGGLFLDGNIGGVWTGPLNRLGFDVGLGYGFPISRWFSLGPVVRYTQIVQPDAFEQMYPGDAQVLSVGLDFGFGPAHNRTAAPVVTTSAPDDEATAPTEVAPTGCRDYDRDGVCDSDDRCPTRIGPPATLGCPIDPCSGAPLLVLVQFDYDSAVLPLRVEGDPQTMDPVLDAVADAIAQDPSCRVCLLGNASEEGPDDYNQELSLRRAEAVRGYLSSRGLSVSRMPTIGLGSRCQLIPETSRLLNRRVEFRRLLEGESCSPVCAE